MKGDMRHRSVVVDAVCYKLECRKFDEMRFVMVNESFEITFHAH
jgi:hypothetical protein